MNRAVQADLADELERVARFEMFALLVAIIARVCYTERAGQAAHERTRYEQHRRDDRQRKRARRYD